mgnify:CR=1 FL=1
MDLESFISKLFKDEDLSPTQALILLYLLDQRRNKGDDTLSKILPVLLDKLSKKEDAPKGSSISLPEAIILSSFLERKNPYEHVITQLQQEVRELRNMLANQSNNKTVEALREEIKALKDILLEMRKKEEEEKLRNQLISMVDPIRRQMETLYNRLEMLRDRLEETPNKDVLDTVVRMQDELKKLHDKIAELKKGSGGDLDQLIEMASRLKTLKDAIDKLSDTFGVKQKAPVTTPEGKPNIAGLIDRGMDLVDKILEKLGGPPPPPKRGLQQGMPQGFTEFPKSRHVEEVHVVEEPESGSRVGSPERRGANKEVAKEVAETSKPEQVGGSAKPRSKGSGKRVTKKPSK